MPAAARSAIACPKPKDPAAPAWRRLGASPLIWPIRAVRAIRALHLDWRFQSTWPREPESAQGLTVPQRTRWAGMMLKAGRTAVVQAWLSLVGLALWRERQGRDRGQELMLLLRLGRLADPRCDTDALMQQLLPIVREFFLSRHCDLVLIDARHPPHDTLAGQSHRLCAPLLWSGRSVQLQLSSPRRLRTAQAHFLNEVAEQINGLLAQCERAQRMAQEAAQQVRHGVARDLHDSAIQPYIGLKLALEALCVQARAGRPLEAGLQQILAMTGRVIEDLRGCQRLIRQPHTGTPPLLGEIERQAQLMQQLHGVKTTVKVPAEPPIGQSLRAQVLHLVREGLSNIRRHTQARSAEVQVECDGKRLALRIANEAAPAASGDFVPRSMSERAAALGGRLEVRRECGGRTEVHVEIPVGKGAAA